MSGSAFLRIDGRRPDELRPVKITRNFIKHAEGSVLFEMGETKVICTVSVEEKVPPFLRGQNRGWVTAEYAMLPRATPERVQREASKGKQGGRTLEIQRLIGRSLRAVTDMDELGERTFWIDCDVIQADGGTRTASVTGAFVALADAVAVIREKGLIKKNPLKDYLAAVSVGKVGGEMLADLCYAEDSLADVDLNLVMTGKGEFVEIQGTAERCAFSQEELQKFLSLGGSGIKALVKIQQDLVGALPLITELVVATGNRHKVEEIRAMLADLPVTVRSLAEFPGAPEVVEDGATYRANALKKARSAVKVTGRPALADDTGLEVDALGGQPGLYAARFAGEGCTFQDNIRKLLYLLEGVPSDRRTARFRCVIALVSPDGREQVVEGELRGRITESQVGVGGFGYDPVFYVPEAGKTLAELTADEKNRISHRRRALDKARTIILAD